MTFYEWLKSIDPERSWDTTNGFDALEQQVIAAIKSGASINLREIFGQFCANEDPGFSESRIDQTVSETKNHNVN